MPNISVALSSTEYSVERPVIYSVVNLLMQALSISSKTPIRFYGDSEQALQPGSYVSQDPKSWIQENNWPADEYLSINVSEDLSNPLLLQKNHNVAGHVYLFNDAKLGVSVVCAYIETTVEVTLKYRASDKDNVVRWLSNMRQRCLANLFSHELQFKYHFLYPEPALKILHEIHRLRENQAGYGEDFAQYFFDHSVAEVGAISDLSGVKKSLVVHESLSGVAGILDAVSSPKKEEKEGEAEAYVAEITYRFTYTKPNEAIVSYPLIIHNQELDEIWRPAQKVTPYAIDSHNKLHVTRNLTNMRDYNKVKAYMAFNGVNIPSYDQEFFPQSVTLSSVRLASICLLIEASAPQVLMNLEKDIPDFDIMPSVLAYLKQEHASITQEYKNIFNLCLYDGTQRVFGDDLQADAQLNLTTKVPCDLRRTYRLRFSILTDMCLIEEASLVRLRPQRALVNQLVVVLNTVLRNKAIEPDIAKNTLNIQDYLLLGYSLKEAQDLWGQNNTGSASDAKDQFLQTLRTFFTAATIEIHNWS